MELYTQRHGLRKPIKRTNKISIDLYGVLLDICEKFYKNITHLYTREQHNEFTNQDYIEFNLDKFEKRMKTKIPDLYRNERGCIQQPQEYDEYDQYALIDLIEYIAQNVKDIFEGWNNEQHKNYWYIECLDTNNIFNQYRDEINELFQESGLLYRLTNDKIVERIIENSPLTPEIEDYVDKIVEKGTRDLIKDAISLYRSPYPQARQDSVEKIWDALERLKTYYTSLDKKQSVSKIIYNISSGYNDYITLFEEEFKSLTKIGNNFRIRHHETNKIDITDNNHYDYLFNRCLSLIALAIQYLE